MNIGTAKPSEEERAEAVHYMIDHISITDEYSVGQYERDVIHLLGELFDEHDVVVLVGGTGLYIKAVTEGLDVFPDVPKEISQRFKACAKEEGISKLQNQLKLQDPDYASRVDMENSHRLIRALSIIETTGLPYSHFLKKNQNARPFKCILLATKLPRQVLYDRINHRVDLMIEAGLIDEVMSLVKYQHLNSLNTVGYKEIFKYLDNEWTLEEAISKIKQHSRNYAKRQITWFNNQQDFKLFDPTNKENVLKFINNEMGL